MEYKPYPSPAHKPIKNPFRFIPFPPPIPLTRMQPTKVRIKAQSFNTVIFSLNKNREKIKMKIGDVYKRITAIEVPSCKIDVK